MKGFLVTLFLMFFLFGLPGRVFAAPEPPVGIQLGVTEWFIDTPVSASQKLVKSIKEPENLNDWSYGMGLFTKFFNYGSLMMVGPMPVDENGKLLVDKNNYPVQIDNGAAGFIARGISALVETKPVSSIDYVAFMGRNLRVPGTPEPAYAAGPGFGFQALQPILIIWTMSRNLAYFLFAVIFIVVGLMIMFRVKIDPKTVASIQNALPKIIFALVIVTFSYAIAGFMIDLMYVLMSLVFTLAKTLALQYGLPGNQVPGIEDAILVRRNSIFDFYLQGWGFGLQANLNAAVAITKLVFGFFFNVHNLSIPGNEGLGRILDGPLTLLFGIIGGPVAALAGILAFFVIALMIIWALFKTWLSLLSAYVSIVLSVMFAPLRLTLDAIPGQNQFTNWLKDLLVNLLVFPLVTTLALIGGIISSGSLNLWGGGFTPPLIGGSGDLPAIQALIGLGILLSIPKSIDILREALKAPTFKYGNAWMESLTLPKFAGQATIGTFRNETGFRGRIYNMARGIGFVR